MRFGAYWWYIPRIMWRTQVMGMDYPPFWKKTSPIVKLTLVPCSKGGTCGVIHSIKGTLYGCVYWLLTDWWTAHYMVHVWQWTWPWHICGEPKNRFDGKPEWTIRFRKWKTRLGSVPGFTTAQPTNQLHNIQVCLKMGGIMWDNSIPFQNSEN